MKSSGFDGAMPLLYKHMSLIATIGTTSVGAERSFSCLNELKRRNAMGQERLTNLAIISIEKKMLKSLEKDPVWYDQVTDIFAAPLMGSNALEVRRYCNPITFFK